MTVETFEIRHPNRHSASGSAQVTRVEVRKGWTLRHYMKAHRLWGVRTYCRLLLVVARSANTPLTSRYSPKAGDVILFRPAGKAMS